MRRLLASKHSFKTGLTVGICAGITGSIIAYNLYHSNFNVKKLNAYTPYFQDKILDIGLGLSVGSFGALYAWRLIRVNSIYRYFLSNFDVVVNGISYNPTTNKYALRSRCILATKFGDIVEGNYLFKSILRAAVNASTTNNPNNKHILFMNEEPRNQETINLLIRDYVVSNLNGDDWLNLVALGKNYNDSSANYNFATKKFLAALCVWPNLPEMYKFKLWPTIDYCHEMPAVVTKLRLELIRNETIEHMIKTIGEDNIMSNDGDIWESYLDTTLIKEKDESDRNLAFERWHLMRAIIVNRHLTERHLKNPVFWMNFHIPLSDLQRSKLQEKRNKSKKPIMK